MLAFLIIALMIIKVAAVIGIVGFVIYVGQWLISRYSQDNEQLRKLVHVMHGTGVAALALLVPLNVVVGIEVMVLISMLIARYLFSNFGKIAWIKYFGKVYNVGRVSYGEFFFPISAIALTFLAESKGEFAASILILGVSDALAALVGKKFGKGNTYLVFGQKKSLAGSVAFFVSTLLIIWGFCIFADVSMTGTSLSLILLTTLIVTVSENLGVYGSDNLLIPLVAVMLLNRL